MRFLIRVSVLVLRITSPHLNYEFYTFRGNEVRFLRQIVGF